MAQPKQPFLQDCITPVGEARLLQEAPDLGNKRQVRVASGGSVCVDVSQMGAKLSY